jgi:hypothetical protein
MGIICPYCNKTIPGDSKICPYCARSIDSTMTYQPSNQIPMQPQNKTNKTIIIIAVVVIAIVLIALIAVPAIIYVYISGNLGTSPEMVPSIQFAKDNSEKKLIVAQSDPNDLLWSDLEIDGTCDTSNLGTTVDPGDTITGCYGTIKIIHKPTNTLIGIWEFE